MVGVLSDETAASPTLSMGIASSCMDRSSLFRLPARGIVRATNPAPTLDPSFAVGMRIAGRFLPLFCRASLRAGVARLLARSDDANGHQATLSDRCFVSI